MKKSVKKPAIKQGLPTLNWSTSRLRALLERSWRAFNKRADKDESDLDDFVLYEVGTALAYSVSEFPGCCAFDVIEGLTVPNGDHSPESLAVLCLELRGEEDWEIDEHIGASYVLASTVPQMKNEEKLLRQIGFKPISTVLNMNTKNQVTLWQSPTKR
jgi:hypothetical protein